jgi:putative transposase
LRDFRRYWEILIDYWLLEKAVWNYALRERKDWLNSRKSQNNACSIEQEYIISPDAPYPNYHNKFRFSSL